MFRQYKIFLRGLAANWIGTAGIVLTTSAFVLMIFLELLRLLGLVTNAYVGLLTYMVLPALFVIGLALIPIGWRRFRKASGRTTKEILSGRYPDEMTEARPRGSRFVVIIAALTVVNILFLGAIGTRTLSFMDEPRFCGTACHIVMSPEWTTYQDSPHARVKCVDCHVGEGGGATVDAKLNGLWQIISSTLNLYERPIPTPVRQLRPARETCEHCHWPDKFYGSRMQVRQTHAFDEASTPSYTTLSLKVGSGTGDRRGEIHWHIAERNEVRYAAADEHRETMLWTEVHRGDGEYWRYTNSSLADSEAQENELRTMDCVDCHNRATHIYEDPERAIDEMIADGRIDNSLPAIKELALKAISPIYADADAADAGIDNTIRRTYAREYRRETASKQREIDEAIAALQAAHRRNIHHRMNVVWGTYPDHRGHEKDGGCFRCHNPEMVDADGHAISYDCTLCHSILAYKSDEPYRFLTPPATADPDSMMHVYLRNEFLGAGR